MTLKLVWTTDGEIVHGAGSLISGGTFSVVNSEDLKISINELGVYFGTIIFEFEGGSASGFVAESVKGGGTITATATKVKTGDGFVLREGDTGTLAAVGAIPGGGTGPVSGPVELDNPGQDKWSAE